MIINIINLPKRTERKEAVIKQMEMEGCQYRFWDGVSGKIAKINIHKAHKSVIRYAKDNNLSEIVVAEDDLMWTGTNAWEYYLENKPAEFDLYVGGYYSGTHDVNFIVKGFCGLTLYTVKAAFYDRFLSLPEHIHIDSALAISGAKIVVCPKFVCSQAPGYSDQRKMFCKNEIKKGKPIYGCN